MPTQDRVLEFLGGATTVIAVALRGAVQRDHLQEVLEETQRQGEERQPQHEERWVTNEELERQADLGEITRRVVRENELHAVGKLLEYTTEGDTCGTWDLVRLSRLTANLVGNAVQHSAAGAILVDLDGRDPAGVVLTTRNPGVIPATVMPQVFEPFRRGGGSVGLGLGLYIVRELARAHGGTITVTSDAASGTTFEIRRPRHATPAGG